MKLIGSYNIAILYREDPQAIYAVKNSGVLSIGRDLVNGHAYLCSDPDVLRDEFNIGSFEEVKENDLVRVSKEAVEHWQIVKNDATMEKVKLKEGISHYFI